MVFLRLLLAVRNSMPVYYYSLIEVVVFNPDENSLTVPLVQVSLCNREDPDQHYALGSALQALREDNILIITSGMAVHNLRFVPSLPFTLWKSYVDFY